MLTLLAFKREAKKRKWNSGKIVQLFLQLYFSKKILLISKFNPYSKKHIINYHFGNFECLITTDGIQIDGRILQWNRRTEGSYVILLRFSYSHEEDKITTIHMDDFSIDGRLLESFYKDIKNNFMNNNIRIKSLLCERD